MYALQNAFIIIIIIIVIIITITIIERLITACNSYHQSFVELAFI